MDLTGRKLLISYKFPGHGLDNAWQLWVIIVVDPARIMFYIH